jgi:hypothetical protein
VVEDRCLLDHPEPEEGWRGQMEVGLVQRVEYRRVVRASQGCRQRVQPVGGSLQERGCTLMGGQKLEHSG